MSGFSAVEISGKEGRAVITNEADFRVFLTALYRRHGRKQAPPRQPKDMVGALRKLGYHMNPALALEERMLLEQLRRQGFSRARAYAIVQRRREALRRGEEWKPGWVPKLTSEQKEAMRALVQSGVPPRAARRKLVFGTPAKRRVCTAKDAGHNYLADSPPVASGEHTLDETREELMRRAVAYRRSLGSRYGVGDGELLSFAGTRLMEIEGCPEAANLSWTLGVLSTHLMHSILSEARKIGAYRRASTPPKEGRVMPTGELRALPSPGETDAEETEEAFREMMSDEPTETGEQDASAEESETYKLGDD